MKTWHDLILEFVKWKTKLKFSLFYKPHRSIVEKIKKSKTQQLANLTTLCNSASAAYNNWIFKKYKHFTAIYANYIVSNNIAYSKKCKLSKIVWFENMSNHNQLCNILCFSHDDLPKLYTSIFLSCNIHMDINIENCLL